MRYSSGASIAFACCALLVGCNAVSVKDANMSRSKSVDLHSGMIELPNDFIHFRGQGIDSWVGDFTRIDGGFRIRYDIGPMAGVYTTLPFDDIVNSNRMTVGTLTAFVVVARWGGIQHAVVSFPDTMANFSADILDDSQPEALKKFVLTYKLKHDDPTK